MRAAPAIIRSHLNPNTMRSISAIIETLNTMKPRICGEKTYHAGKASGPREKSVRSCCFTIVRGLREPVKNTRAMTERIIGISYAVSSVKKKKKKKREKKKKE